MDAYTTARIFGRGDCEADTCVFCAKTFTCTEFYRKNNRGHNCKNLKCVTAVPVSRAGVRIWDDHELSDQEPGTVKQTTKDSTISYRKSCTHHQCEDCMTEHIKSVVAENRDLVYKCPAEDCTRKWTVGQRWVMAAIDEMKYYAEQHAKHAKELIEFGQNIETVMGMASSDGGVPACTICTIRFTDGDIIHKTPCDHYYHKNCMDKLIETTKDCDFKCPNCREGFDPRELSPPYD